MQLHLRNLVPHPLKEHDLSASAIWGREVAVAPGDQVFFKAASGKGKSTFMHILYGLRTDFSGDALWAQHSVKEVDPARWAHWRSTELSLVFQDLRLFPELTVGENLLLKQGLQARVPTAEIKHWAGLLGIGDKWEQSAGTLSYGEQQRVAIIRALLQPFKWLLLDEPFSHLDREHAGKAAGLISEQVAQQQAGLLMVDLEENDWFAYTHTLLL